MGPDRADNSIDMYQFSVVGARLEVLHGNSRLRHNAGPKHETVAARGQFESGDVDGNWNTLTTFPEYEEAVEDTADREY